MGKGRLIRKKKAHAAKKAARELVDSLFHKVKEVYARHPKRAQRYVTLARKAAMKVRMRLQPWHKALYCKKCYQHLIPGKTARIRIHRGKRITRCLHCNHTMRFPLHR